MRPGTTAGDWLMTKAVTAATNLRELTYSSRAVSGFQLGRYFLFKRLAQGGMAEVWLANHQGPAGFQKQVVVKRILPHLAEDKAFVEMFLNEARLASQLDHPNIAQ